MDELFNTHVSLMLLLFKKIVTGKRLVNLTGKINAKGDKSIGMDIRVEEEFVQYLKESKLPVSVFSEENGIIPIHKNPQFIVAFDPLDGSTNYRIGKGLLPYGCLIAIYKGPNPKIKNVVASGAIEVTRDLMWIYNGKVTTDKSRKKVLLKNNWEINKSTPLYLDLYYKAGYKKYQTLPEKVFIRNAGSTIGNLSFLLAGVSTGLGSVCMRPEEIGAVYSLIKGSGGKVVDYKGNDLGDKEFDGSKTYPILGGVSPVIDFCLNEIKNDANKGS